jgi:DNA-binding transcriptional MerR regulator
MMQFVPKKLYYKIGEVCHIVGVEPHVLRYWESEFARLSPPKNKAGQRTYRPKDIELLLQIRKLLYEDGFTIAGARKQLNSASPPPKGAPLFDSNHSQPPARARQRAATSAKRLNQVRKELENILTLLDRE